MTLITDEHYEEDMASVVCPYLSVREEELWLERQPGEKIHCIHYKADDAKGIVIISHGFTESAGKYKEAAYYFLKRDYHVYIPEHCGHGASYRLIDDLSKVYVDDYKRYVMDFSFVAAKVCRDNHMHLPVYLFAHSMGATIGLLTAAKHPELFSKIILSSPMIQPLAGGVPWTAAVLIARKCKNLGKDKSYVLGMQPYNGPGRFVDSCSTSFERFDYYERQRAQNEQWQTNAATYSWLCEAERMSQLLLNHVYKKIMVPVLVFQAGEDKIVSLSAQDKFVRLLDKRGQAKTSLYRIDTAKHEIYNSTSEEQEIYWKKIFEFLADKDSEENNKENE